MTPDMAAIGRRVAEMRQARGWSGDGLARRAGVDGSTVRAVERGTSPGLNVSTLAGLARAFGVPVGVLLGDEELPATWAVGRVRWDRIGREIEALQAHAQERKVA